MRANLLFENGLRRLRRGSRACSPMGSRQLRCPKVSKGRAESPLVRPQVQPPCPGWGLTRRLRRGWGLAVLWVLASFGARRFPKGERKALWCARWRILLRRVGIDAPTTARIGTYRPMGRSHFSFDGERKVCKRKPAARRLREKALYCPFLKEGVRNVARRPVSEITHTFVRARAHSFPLSKRARLFPSAAYRRPRPRSWRRACLSLAGWGASVWLEFCPI